MERAIRDVSRLLFLIRHFRACRLFLPSHCHVNCLCPMIAAEWEAMCNRRDTYRLWLLFRSDMA